MWEYIEPGYYITLESCLQDSCNGEKLLEEILGDHLQRSEGANREESIWLVIDTYLLSLNWDEHKRFRKKIETYEREGFTINESF